MILQDLFHWILGRATYRPLRQARAVVPRFGTVEQLESRAMLSGFGEPGGGYGGEVMRRPPMNSDRGSGTEFTNEIRQAAPGSGFRHPAYQSYEEPRGWSFDRPRGSGPAGMANPESSLPFDGHSSSRLLIPAVAFQNSPRRTGPASTATSIDRLAESSLSYFASYLWIDPLVEADWLAIGIEATEYADAPSTLTIDWSSASIKLTTDLSESPTGAASKQSPGDGGENRDFEAISSKTQSDGGSGAQEWIELDATDSLFPGRRKARPPKTVLKAVATQQRSARETVGEFKRQPMTQVIVAAIHVDDDDCRSLECTIEDGGLIELLAGDVSPYSIVRESMPNSENQQRQLGSNQKAPFQANMAISQSQETETETEVAVHAAESKTTISVAVPTVP